MPPRHNPFSGLGPFLFPLKTKLLFPWNRSSTITYLMENNPSGAPYKFKAQVQAHLQTLVPGKQVQDGKDHTLDGAHEQLTDFLVAKETVESPGIWAGDSQSHGLGMARLDVQRCPTHCLIWIILPCSSNSAWYSILTSGKTIYSPFWGIGAFIPPLEFLSETRNHPGVLENVVSDAAFPWM